MLAFPDIDPVLISIGTFNIYWYSLAYVLGILFGWYYANKIVEKFQLNITQKNLEDFVTWATISIVVGGRLGYVLFYDPIKYLNHPIDILKTYEGGMSFHGAILSLIFTTYLFSRKYKISFLNLLDIISIGAPFGLFLGRICNFINSELYGRVTNIPWAVIFPKSDMQPRHPSQIYEAIAEGIILFTIMAISVFKFRTIKFEGRTAGIFLICYSIFRIIIENFREPDLQVGFILQSITMGQILSVPMLLMGIYLFIRSKCQLTQT